MKIMAMEQDIAQHKKDIQELIAHHEQEEEQRIAALEEVADKWYEKEMVKVGGVSLNPFSWKKKRGKGE
jgi:hypothetical protein